MPLPAAVHDAIERSAAPPLVRVAVERLCDAQPALAERLADDAVVRDAVLALAAASRSLTVLLEADDHAWPVLADIDRRVPCEVEDPAGLRRWKARELLRLAARDLMGLDDLRATTASLSELAADVLAAAVAMTSGDRDAGVLAVIGMGKLGARELNYASDIDVMFVGEGDTTALERRARHVLDIARGCFRVDANLRPQGRDGPLVRTLASYEAYWERWADPWEFQALLKARPTAGDAELGDSFARAAAARLWSRTFSADDLRSLRSMKARAEAEVAKRGLSTREIKRGPGGIRDIEFSMQLLQLVHGRNDERIRVPATLDALEEMAAGGYIDAADAESLAEAYTFLRTVEHRLQLMDEQQVHTIPEDLERQSRLARVMGFRDSAAGDARELFRAELSRQQSAVRSIHERLYFRPLLEAFAGVEGPPPEPRVHSTAPPETEMLARPGAAEDRLRAFGFADAIRTRAAVRELTRGLTRSSRLMQQMLPLLLEWLSEAPDPDLGLLCLRNLASGQRATQLATVFRDSPEAARRLCLLIGTSRLMYETVLHNPDLIARLPYVERLRTLPRDELIESAQRALSWRVETEERQVGLRRWKERHLFGIAARDLLEAADIREVGRDITALAEATLEVALEALEPKLPFAVIALGRFGGSELSYASDLDVVFVYDGTSPSDFAEAERLAIQLRRFVMGATPSARIWDVDVDLRPEGKQGPMARSVEGYATYFSRWALVWERQAMLRARPVAGDPIVASKFMDVITDFVWGRGLSEEETREIRRIKARVERERISAHEDPQFHLKLGRGALVDIEFTAQLLQLRHGVRSPSTIDALYSLRHEGVLTPHDADILIEAYEFCERTRNRWFLVNSAPGDALPQRPEQLAWLARSLDTDPRALREDYRRVTRRARAVVERVFYGR